MNAKLEDLHPGNKPETIETQWQGEDHPYASINPGDMQLRTAGGEPQSLDMRSAYEGGEAQAPTELPPQVQQAIASGAPIRFSSSGEDQAANRQPDFYMTPQGQLIANPNATPSADGSVNIELQSANQANNQSLRDAITHETDMQKAGAKDMIRLWQKDHPNQPVPAWMNDLANARPNLPDFVPFTPPGNAPATPPSENGFVPRGVPGGGSPGGSAGAGDGGFAGNGGFNNQGYFQGNGGQGDGALQTGGRDSHGQPLGQGEQVKAKDIYDYMTNQYHLSPAQASGILGNMQTESSFNTDAYNKGEGAIGLCQWEGNRRTQLEAFASTPAEQAKAQADGQSNPVLDWKVQVDFMMHEMQGGSESKAWQALQASTTPAQAAAAFDQYYERSSGAARGQREANANNIAAHVASA